MNFGGLMFLLITQFLSGWGFLRMFKLKMQKIQELALSMILGIALFSFIPFILQLLYIHITSGSVLISIVLLCIGINIPGLITLFRNYGDIQFDLKKLLSSLKRPQLYEYPFILFFIYLCVISAWVCFYFPVAARDMLSGPEAIAEYTVREKTMLNSVFSVDLSTTNNHLKPPFVTCLQIIYKLLVCPFGQVWMSVLFISFITWLYSILKERLHPVLAGLVLLFFVTIPELFGYSHIILFDYSNMLFFFCGFYFITKYVADKQTGQFFLASVFFVMATYTRLETLVLEAMIVPLLLYIFYKEKLPLAKIAFRITFFLLAPAFIYFIWMNVYVKYYMPVHFNLGEEINPKLTDIGPFFTRIAEMNTRVLFGNYGSQLFGDYLYIFGIFFLIDIIFYRKYNYETKIMLYGIVLVYFGLPLLGFLLPWFDLMNTTKRGFFKMFPLMLIYISNSGLLQTISGRIKKWEFASNDDVKKAQAKTPAPAYSRNMKAVTTNTAATTNSKNKKGKK